MEYEPEKSCPSCGTILEEEDVECPSCGESLASEDDEIY